MSFIQNDPLNTLYQPGWFLAFANCTRKTVQVAQNHSQVVTKANGAKYVPAGALISGVGLLYEDVDVSTGAMPGSVVTEGTVYEDRLPASYDSTAKNGIPGIKFISAAPAIVRPTSFNKDELDSITVASVAGSGSGKTDVSVSGYTLGAGEKLVYKIASAAAPVVHLGEVLEIGDGKWTVGTFPLDELTATTGHHITVAAVDSIGAAVAEGHTTITSKA